MVTYRPSGYASMLEDRVRRDAYARALQAVLRPGAIVADIGTGTGFFAVLACRLGARRVYAIEPGDVIQVAREVARANGCADRIVFEQKLSTQLTLPEPVDVVISDLRGVLPWFEMHLPSIVDARERLLARSGALIPQQDRLWVSVVEAQDSCRSVIEPVLDGVDMAAASAVLANQWFKDHLAPRQLVTTPVNVATLDYQHLTGTDLDAQAQLTATRAGEAHAIAAWFDAILAPGIGFSNAPGERRVYGQAVFPWPQAVALEPGDRIEIGLRARLTGPDYLWVWRTTVHRGDRVLASFEQSDFHGQLLSPQTLKKAAAAYVPELCAQGEQDLFVLERFARREPLGTIADALMAVFPDSFRHRKEALARVGELSMRYSR
jgi:protein arginine N-methyltransferase 1